MNPGYFLAAAVFAPLVSAALLPFVPARSARAVSLACAVLFGVLSLLLLGAAAPAVEGKAWIEWALLPEFGFRVALEGDPFAIVLLILTAGSLLAAVVAAWEEADAPSLHHSLLHATAAGAAGVFATEPTALLSFYFFWELALVPMFLLILRWGSPGPNRRRAAYGFLVYTILGSLPLLLAILAQLDATAGPFTDPFGLVRVEPRSLLFFGFLLAFAVKLPLWPLHAWLPDAHTEAPTSASILLAAVLLKMGGWGMYRILAGHFPDVFGTAAPLLLLLGIAGIWMGAWMAWREEDAKRIIAYSSVSHMGFVVLGIASGTPLGARGAAFILVAHGITSAGLFFWFGSLYGRRHSRQLSDFGGLADLAPGYSVFAAALVFAGIALPGTVGFVGEFLVIAGATARHPFFGVAAACGAVFSAAYALRLLARVLYGEAPKELVSHWTPLAPRELAVLAALAILAIAGGLFPGPILRAAAPSADATAHRVFLGSVGKAAR